MVIISPLSVFEKPESSVCIWLNGMRDAERPVWKRLWNMALLRYCTDGAANYIIERCLDLKLPNVVSGDFDSIEETTKQFLEKKARVIEMPDQNKTDLTKCLELVLIDTKLNELTKRIVLLGGLSGRFDHTLATINSVLDIVQNTNREVYIVDGTNLTFVLQEGNHQILIDRKLITGKSGIVPFCQVPTVTTTKGFKWELNETEISFGKLISTSNEIESDLLDVTSTAPLIITMELKESTLI